MDLPSAGSLPHDNNAEKAVICAVLRDNAAFHDLAQLVQTNDFYLYAHQQIWKAFLELDATGKPIDAVTTFDVIAAAGVTQDIGGAAYLVELYDASPSARNARNHADIVVECSRRRDIVRACQEAATDAGQGRPIEELLAAHHTAIEAVKSRSVRGEFESAMDLVKKQIPPTKWAINGLVPDGLTILAGKPKIGKSWLFLAAGLSVAAGANVFGNWPCDQGDVLYLALEDTERRLQARINSLIKKIGIGPPEAFIWLLASPRADRGGISLIESWLLKHPGARMVVIDTWAKFKPLRGRNRDAYEEDYEHASQLKALADKYGVAIVIVHHCRKMVSDDQVDTIAGSTGLSGAVDATLVLRRDRNKSDGILFMSGRDIEEAEAAMVFDGGSGLWTNMGAAAPYVAKTETGKALEVLRANGKPMKPAEVAELLGKERRATSMLLLRAKENDLCEGDSKTGYYLLN